MAELAARPGIFARQLGIPLRWMYPDAFFHFQDTGDLTLTLRGADFRSNETEADDRRTSASSSTTDGSVPAAGLERDVEDARPRPARSRPRPTRAG